MAPKQRGEDRGVSDRGTGAYREGKDNNVGKEVNSTSGGKREWQ